MTTPTPLPFYLSFGYDVAVRWGAQRADVERDGTLLEAFHGPEKETQALAYAFARGYVKAIQDNQYPGSP
jgi:hypothetical protein